MVWGLDDLEQPHWDHVTYDFGVIVGHESSEETDECNGSKCCRQHIDGQSATVGFSQVKQDARDSVQEARHRYYLEGQPIGHLLEAGFFKLIFVLTCRTNKNS